MKGALLLLAGALLVGCDSEPSKPAPPPPSPWVHSQGYVRYVAFGYQDPHSTYSHVILETEDGVVFTVNLLDSMPPVWVGLHGQFAYEASNQAGIYKNFLVLKRLPDAPEVKK